MALHPLSGIELFSGVGMLGEGLRAGLAHLGIAYRTLCHVEREAHAAAVLAARMEEGSLDAAPVWSDVCTFDAWAWHGRVDCVAAGFPCQDLSIAGRRAGLDGKRSGLFFEVCRIATDSGAWLMLLENVAGIASATASVVDPEEGELDERAASRVVGELADLGWDAEWITLSASDMGASHGRARWFCIAWRVADAERSAGGIGRVGLHGEASTGEPVELCQDRRRDVDDARRHGRHGLDGQGGSGRGVRAAGAALAHADGRDRGQLARPDQRRLPQPHGGAAGGPDVEQPESIGRQERRPEPARIEGRPDVAVDGGTVAHTRREQRQAGHEQGGSGCTAPAGHEGDDRPADGGLDLADPGCRDVCGHEPQPVGWREEPAGDHAGGTTVADTSSPGWRCAQGCDEPGQRCLEEQGLAGCGECGWDAVGRPEVVGERMADPGIQRCEITARGGGMPDRMKNRTASPSLSQVVTHSHSLPQAQPTPDGPPSSPNTPSSPRHLNPLFGAWLMGWPSTWVIAEPHASSASATELWRSKLQSQLSCLLGELGSST